MPNARKSVYVSFTYLYITLDYNGDYSLACFQQKSNVFKVWT